MPPTAAKDTDSSREQSRQVSQNAGTSQQNTPAPGAPVKPKAPKPPRVHIPFLDRLRELPEVRSIPWRPGQELPPEKGVDSPRVQQRGAILLVTRGNVAETPCEHCSMGYGRFGTCITLDHWFQGACSTCIYTSKGNTCSLRTQVSGNADGRALRYHTNDPEVLQNFIKQAKENPKPPKKRKRRNEVEGVTSAEGSYTSPYQQRDSPAPVSPDEDSLIQAQIASEQAASPSREAAPAVNQQQWQHDPSQANIARVRGPATYTSPYASQPVQPPQEPPHQQVQQNLNQPPLQQPALTALPTPQPPPIPQAHQHHQQQTYTQPQYQLQTRPTLKPPRTEVLVPTPAYQPPPVWSSHREHGPNEPPINTIVRRPLPLSANEVRQQPSPIIDNVPKVKQRQLYSVVSGLQGGIDNLQKQLDSLKGFLGIEDNDDDGDDEGDDAMDTQ